MPELPEVEIVRESLNKKIRQKKVENVIVRNRKLRFKIPLNFENFLRYQKILEVSRFSKYLIFKLSNKSFVYFIWECQGLSIYYTQEKKFSDKYKFL